MFNLFVGQARDALGRCREEAIRLGHEYIGTEHILLGLLSCDGCAAQVVLGARGLSVEKARREVEHLAPPRPGHHEPSGQLPFSPRAKRVLEVAVEQAQKHGHPYVGTGHLLLGILGVPDGVGAAVLTEFLINSAEIGPEILAATERIEGAKSPAGAAPAAASHKPIDPSAPMLSLLQEIRNELRTIREILELDRQR